jgi:hypothetical protein
MLLLLAMVGQPAPGDIKIDYDQAQDSTSIFMVLGHAKEQGNFIVDPVILAGHDGKARPKQLSDLVTLSVRRMGYEYQWQDSHVVRLTCGKARMNHRQDSYVSDMKDGYHREIVLTQIMRADLRKALDTGKDIEMTIGAHQTIGFGVSAREKMSAFLRYLDEYPGGQHPRGKTR